MKTLMTTSLMRTTLASLLLAGTTLVAQTGKTPAPAPAAAAANTATAKAEAPAKVKKHHRKGKKTAPAAANPAAPTK